MSRGNTPDILAYLREREMLKRKFYQDQRKANQAMARVRPAEAA